MKGYRVVACLFQADRWEEVPAWSQNKKERGPAEAALAALQVLSSRPQLRRRAATPRSPGWS